MISFIYSFRSPKWVEFESLSGKFKNGSCTFCLKDWGRILVGSAIIREPYGTKLEPFVGRFEVD